MRRFSLSFLLAGVGMLGFAWSSIAEPLPRYQPEQPVSGVIRIWGHGSRQKDFAGDLVESWEAGFRVQQPGVRFETFLRGDSTGIGGLYTGAADMALMQRSPISIELDAYLPIFKHPPFEVTVATGSLDIRDHNPALVVFVNRANPLSRLTLAELDAVLGADGRRGLKPVHVWGELGLKGKWAKRPIAIYIPAISSSDAQYLENAVMGGSQKWAGNLREFSASPGGPDPGQQILDALARNPYAIAVSTMVYRQKGIKPLALAPGAEGPYVVPSRATVADHSYPLARTVSLVTNHVAGKTGDNLTMEFLRYVLSAEGQAAIARDGKYLPLTPEMVQAERKKLQ